MTRSLIILFAALSVCPALAGCLHQAELCCNRSAQDTPWDVLPGIERGSIEVDGELPATAAISPSASGRFAYRALTAENCQCLAVRNAGMANLLDAERDGVAEQAARSGWLRSHGQSGLSDMKETILVNTAEEIRNRNAAAALELYYRLAEAEAKADLAEQSLQMLRDIADKLQDMKKKGLRLPVDGESLTRQQLDVQVQQIQIQQAIGQLNGELKRLLGLHGCTADQRLWPVDNFSKPSESLDSEAAIVQALAQRPELRLLREVNERLDVRTLPPVEQLAKSLNGLLGMMEQPPRLLLAAVLLRGVHGGSTAGTELEIRRQQLRQHLANREKEVAEEVRQAARIVAAQQQLVALHQQKVRSWETGVRELEDRNKQGLTSVTEVAMTKLDWLRARGDLIKEVMARDIARVKLKQAQGSLSRECGGLAAGREAAECTGR